MPIEIERKFLIKESYKPQGKGEYIAQGYLTTQAECTVRVRIKDEAGYLTVKGKTQGIRRSEYEYEIPLQDAKDMLKMCANLIEKRRYKVEYAGKIFEIDEFFGDNAGLILAEIELASENETFDKPKWLDKEVSADARYFNSNLSKNPYKNWRN